jgi:coenzyme F420-0:L-glutamate ligase/coenzyme F420-1:gamma-L-glutamate ligase
MLRNRSQGISVLPISGLPEIRPGDSLAELIVGAARGNGIEIRAGDVLMVTQKIVSKAEGRLVRLQEIEPSPRALELARQGKRDPRHLEVVLRESKRLVRVTGTLIIAETKHGFKCANAGVDHSNVPGEDTVSLLPADPDGSARRLQKEIERLTGVRVAIIITDTFGRPWRLGLVNVAIGAAGMKVLKDYRNTLDAVGKKLTATVVAIADELAAAAGLAMGKADGVPVVLIRGYGFEPGEGKAADLIRPKEQDLFP